MFNLKVSLLLPLLAFHVESVVFLGKLSELQHGVKGRVAALSPDTLLITRFHYDGTGPEAFFTIGTSGLPGDEDATILSYPWDGKAYDFSDVDAPVIGNSFTEDDVILHLPDNIKADQVAWVSIWSRQISVDFGSIVITEGIDFSSLSDPMRRPDLSDTQHSLTVGRLSEKAHGVKGKVTFTSPNSLVLSEFSYDGLGPQAFFLVGTSGSPGEGGTILSYPADGKAYDYFDQNAPILRKSFNNEDVMLLLPDNIKADQVAWVSIWCREFSVDFGSVMVPEGLDFGSLTAPIESPVASNDVRVGPLSENAHGVKGYLTFTSDSSLVLSDFSYDGLGPQSFFLVGTSGSPGEGGTIISYPADGMAYNYFDEEAPILRRSFSNEDLMLILPENIKADQVAWVSVWCREFSVDFGSIMVPEGTDFSRLETNQFAPATPARPAPSNPVTRRPTTTRRPAPPMTTEGPRFVPNPTSIQPIIIPDQSVAVRQFQEIFEEKSDIIGCFEFTKGRDSPLVPGVIDSSTASLLLPQSGRAISFMLPNPALMVEAYSNNGVYLGKLTALQNSRTWTLDLGQQEVQQLILRFTVRPGSSSAQLARLTTDGQEVSSCATPTAPTVETTSQGFLQGIVARLFGQQPDCVTVDMAMYGKNIGFYDNVETPQRCWELCQGEPSCKFWNHNMYDAFTVNRTGKVGRCHVKKARGKKSRTVAGYTFGARDCSPQ